MPMTKSLKIGLMRLALQTRKLKRQVCLSLSHSLYTQILQSTLQPEDWDEDAPYEIPDEEAVKPEGWLDDEPDMVPDPGNLPQVVAYVCFIIPFCRCSET